jgi:hypothetical protein
MGIRSEVTFLKTRYKIWYLYEEMLNTNSDQENAN